MDPYLVLGFLGFCVGTIEEHEEREAFQKLRDCFEELDYYYERLEALRPGNSLLAADYEFAISITLREISDVLQYLNNKAQPKRSTAP